MIPCYRIHGSRRQLNKKPIQVEYNIWVFAAEAYGHVVQFIPYQGLK